MPANIPLQVLRVARTIENQNSTHPFMETFIKKEGMPLFEKSLIYLSQRKYLKNSYASDTVVLVPVAHEGDSLISSFLACDVRPDTVLIKLIRGREYKNYSFTDKSDSISANAIAMQLMAFQKKVFGDSVFRIDDDRLFNYKNSSGQTIKPEYITLKSSGTKRSGNNLLYTIVSWYECYPVIYDGNKGQLVGVAPGGTVDYPGEIGEVCYYNSVWIYSGGGSGDGKLISDTEIYIIEYKIQKRTGVIKQLNPFEAMKICPLVEPRKRFRAVIETVENVY